MLILLYLWNNWSSDDKTGALVKSAKRVASAPPPPNNVDAELAQMKEAMTQLTEKTKVLKYLHKFFHNKVQFAILHT